MREPLVEFEPIHPEGLLVVISGPSGVGKDAVLHEMKRRNLPLAIVVTATTRLPREGEVEGEDYFFVSNSRFAEMIDRDELLEYSRVYNEDKGVPKEQARQALASGKDVVLRVDVQGAEKIRKIYPQAVLIFLTVENEAVIVNRLAQRSTENADSFKVRIATILQEMTRLEQFDYVITNRQGKLGETVDIIQAILCAEHHRVRHRQVKV